MAFHSRYSQDRRSSGLRRTEKESILGLSGWLFADLLLAIAVIFLVIQSRPGTDEKDVLQAKVAALQSENAELKAELASLKLSLGEGAKGGLLADTAMQVTMYIPNGTRLTSASSFESAFGRSQILLGGQKTTLRYLREHNYRVGFIIWFADTPSLSRTSAASGLRPLVQALKGRDLITDEQMSSIDSEQIFPHLAGYTDVDVTGSSLKVRMFLFPLIKGK